MRVKLVPNFLKRRSSLDKTPVAKAVDFERPMSLEEKYLRSVATDRQTIASVMSELARSQGLETLEEAEDFDVPEDDMPVSQHELVWDEDLRREVPKFEKTALDSHRANARKAIEMERKKASDKKRFDAEEDKRREFEEFQKWRKAQKP